MRINFRQGLVSSEIGDTGQPNFLTGNGLGITIRAVNRPVVFSLASGPKNYTISFFVDVLAWPVSLFSGLSESWLYIDINQATSERSYGVTGVAPTHGLISPPNPVDGQMWFDTTKTLMKVYRSETASWAPRLRIIAGRLQATSLTSVQFGTQVGLNVGSSVNSGSIIADGLGKALKDSLGYFITSEDVLLVDGASTHAAKLESNVTTLSAVQPIAAFHAIRYTDDGRALPATYEDIGDNVIGIATTDANINEPVTIVLSGKVHNPMWNWGSANVTLWVDNAGELVALDPFELGGRAKRRVPVARTIDSNTIIFDQGLGGVGEKGDPGDLVGLQNASISINGVTKLSVSPQDFANPIAVGINDPILTSPKVPIDHAHPATQVTVSPFGTFNGTNTQQALEHLQSNKLNLSGGLVIGNISSLATAIADTHLITLGQTKTLISATTTTYKRYTLSASEQSIVVAFNLLTPIQRTFSVNTTVVLEWKDSVYLWTGGAGAPTIASIDAQFMLIGKMIVAANLGTGIRIRPYVLTSIEGTLQPSLVINEGVIVI